MGNKYSNKLPLSYEICGIKLNIFEPGWQSQSDDVVQQGEHSGRNSPHSHFAFEVFFTAEGTLALITDRNTEVYERKIVIVPPRCRHCSTWQRERGICLLFAFDVQQAEKDKRVKQIMDVLSQGICAYPLEADTAFYVRMAVEKLEYDDPVSIKETELLIGLLFCRVLEKLLPDSKTESVTQRRSKHINAIESYVNANIYQPIALADVADNVYLSVRQASRIVAREYHCTLHRFIVERKLDTAEALVKNTDMKIAEIAAMLHLGSDNYFYALFKKRYGMTPLQYRKAAKN